MLNKIMLQGRLVADPALKQTPSGVAAASFRLAVERDFKDKESGQKQTDFVTCVAWRQTGEFVSRYFTKGCMALVEGRLQTRDYTDRDGNKRTAAEVVAEKVYFEDSKREGQEVPREAPAASSYAPSGQDQDPFRELTEDDGELPF